MIYNPSETSLRICAVLQHREEQFLHTSEDSIYIGKNEEGFMNAFRSNSKKYNSFESYLENEQINITNTYLYDKQRNEVTVDMNDVYTLINAFSIHKFKELGEPSSVQVLYYLVQGESRTATFYVFDMNDITQNINALNSHEDVFWAIVQCSQMRHKYREVTSQILTNYLQTYAYVQQAISVIPLSDELNSVESWYIYKLPSMHYHCVFNNKAKELPASWHKNSPKDIMGHSINENIEPKPLSEKEVIDMDYYQYLSLLNKLNNSLSTNFKHTIQQYMFDYLAGCTSMGQHLDRIYSTIR